MLIENREQLKSFLQLYNSNDSILIPIQSDDHKHPIDTELSLLYVQLLSGEEFMLPLNHSETLNIELPDLNSDTIKYTHDKKKLGHLIELDNIIDVNLLYYMETNELLNIDHIETEAHHFFNTRFYQRENIDTIIPVLKHLEKCRKVAKILKDTIEKYSQSVNLSYNNEVLDNLSYIEQNGLQTTDGVVHSEYNIYTSTGRPSNRFGGINFAALNKTDGSRKQFVSRFDNGVLVEMDYDSFHLRLIADKINYEFPGGSVHEHMAKLYGVDYDAAKKLSFRYLYGHIPIEVVQLNPFFAGVYDYINDMWREYNLKEFIESDIYSKRMYKKNLRDMNASKLFNYTIQLMETESNMKVLNKLISEIKDYESKLVLYSYDSFLLDFNMSDGLDYLNKVKNILEQDGKFPVKVAWGTNYHDMKDITEKFVD